MGGKRAKPEILAEVERLLREGGTATSIGAAVGKSRNVIVGLVHRHLLHIGFKRAAPSMVKLVKKRRKIERDRERLKEVAQMRPEDIEVIEPEPSVTKILLNRYTRPIEPEQPAPPPNGQIRLQDLSSVHCRWPMWGDDVTDVEQKFFCGRAKARGSYCDKHAAKMFTAARR